MMAELKRLLILHDLRNVCYGLSELARHITESKSPAPIEAPIAPSIDTEKHEQFLSMTQVAERWKCSKETVKRRIKSGWFKPLRFNKRFVRVRMSEVIECEIRFGLR